MTFDARLTELIAIGAAVAANCASCLQHHAGKAREAGLDEGEILAAVEVGLGVRRGAAATIDRVVSRLGIAAPGAPIAGARGCACA